MNSKTNSQKTVLEADPLDQPLAKRARISNEESVETDISDEFNAIAKSPGLQHCDRHFQIIGQRKSHELQIS